MTTTTNINTLNEAIIDLQDKHIKTLEKARALDAVAHELELTRMRDVNESLQADQAELLERISELDSTVSHWQDLWEREHAAFTQAAMERDAAIRRQTEMAAQAHNWRRRAKALEARCEDLQAGLNPETHEARGDTINFMTAFIDNLCEMVACDCELADLADECMLWRRGEWTLDDEGRSDAEVQGRSDAEVSDDVSQRRSDPATSEEYEELEGGPHKWKVLVVERQGDAPVFTGFYVDYDLARESVDLMVGRGCYEAWVEEVIL